MIVAKGRVISSHWPIMHMVSMPNVTLSFVALLSSGLYTCSGYY